jgi:hypothetical protein
MNHLPKLSAGVRRTAGAVPTTLGRGVVAAWRINSPVFPNVPGDDFMPLPFIICNTPCLPDPNCLLGGAHDCTAVGPQGPFTVRQCCYLPEPVCEPCECEHVCTRYDGTTFTESCHPDPGSSCCKVRAN